ncbi:MAG: hypothetical protein Q8P18_33235 [Pseudomonadota bacterium]|nr:hypothetical protein [Pseudomonadota bacterium]
MSRSRVASGSSSFVPSGITGSIAAAVDQGQPVADEQVAQSQLAIDIPDTSTVQAVALDDDDGADLSVDADLDLSVDLDGDGPPLYKRPIVWIGIVGIAGLCWWKRDLLKLKYLSMKGA